MHTLATVRDFLAQKRIAMIGVSRDPKHFSRLLFKSLRERGYEMLAVNPEAEEIDGARCYRSVAEIAPAADAALLMTSSEATAEALRGVAAAGISRVWLYRATGKGAVSEEALAFGRAQGWQMVEGECPYMFLEGSGWFHHFHGTIKRWTGSYPK